MSTQNASIQSFFPPSSFPSAPLHPSSSARGDGFTTDEIKLALACPPPQLWKPTEDYERFTIGDLQPGPRHVTFSGRIANLNDASKSGHLPRAAKGSIKLIVVDATSSITVRLCYSKYVYDLRLGQLVTIWATRISNVDHGNLMAVSVPLSINMFPEREKISHLEVFDEAEDCTQHRTPTGIGGCFDGQKLMTLRSYVEGGWEVNGAKIIVLIKSIGARRKVMNKDGHSHDVVSVGVFDDSTEASLSLWGITAASANGWTPSLTVLLITSPGCNSSQRHWLSLTSTSLVEINPDLRDTAWLRVFAGRFAKREHVNPAFPLRVNTTALIEDPSRILYTLADIDQQVRESPKGQSDVMERTLLDSTEREAECFSGFLNLVILELKYVVLYRRRMLLCAECCGVPLYSNSEKATCKQCERQIMLRLNPQTVGTLVDETGCIGAGKLVLSGDAWTQLLGCLASETFGSLEDVRMLEENLLYKRVTMMFYWSMDIGKLAIVQVSWNNAG